MVNLAGTTYIDIFNSFLPNRLPDRIQKSYKLLFKKHKKFPHKHDKIEFEIVETCYDFNTRKKVIEIFEPKRCIYIFKIIKGFD